MTTVIGKDAKDPTDKLPYVMNWRDDTGVGPWLETQDSIATSSWNVESGITEGTGAYVSTFDNDTATIWLEGGTAGETYIISNTITTSPSPAKTVERSFAIEVKQL